MSHILQTENARRGPVGGGGKNWSHNSSLGNTAGQIEGPHIPVAQKEEILPSARPEKVELKKKR